MNRYIFTFLVFFFPLFNLATATSQVDAQAFNQTSPLQSTDPIRIELLSEDETIQEGHPFFVAVRLLIDKDWHTYWKNPGDVGLPALIEWQLPAGFTVGPIQWPCPKQMDVDSTISFGYEGEVWILALITPPETFFIQQLADFKVTVEWLICSHADCLPGESQATLSLPVTPHVPKPRLEWIEAFKKAKELLPKSHWHVEAERKEGLIELQLQAPPNPIDFSKKEEYSKNSYKEASFFPEHKNRIDSKIPAVLTSDPQKPGAYTVILKEQPFNFLSSTVHSHSLKGVLLLRSNLLSSSDEASSDEVLEIDLQLKPAPHFENLAMAGDLPLLIEPTDAIVENIKEGSSDAFSYQGGIVLALILAFVGGILLNLMPCVLPVISFKILSFVKLANQSRRVTINYGLAFTAGIVISFWILAGILLTFQAYGNSVGWGFQLQEPLFVAVLATLLFVFGLSLFGLFEFGHGVTALAGQVSAKSHTGLLSSFFSGIMATAVATPCTGPFLGTAIGFAVTLPSLLALLIFTSLALGMAAPYLLLSFFPQFLRFMPKAGNWMIVFREVVALSLFATVIWLLWVFSAQTGASSLILLLISLFIFFCGCWILGKWGTVQQTRGKRWVVYVLVTLCFIVGSYPIFLATANPIPDKQADSALSSSLLDWESFSFSRLTELQSKGVPVFVDFTAKWCLICQANHLVLESEAVSKNFEKLGIVKMKADWTRKDMLITQALAKFGRNGVPLYLLYGIKEEAPLILPQILTPSLIYEELTKLEQQIKATKNNHALSY